MSDLIYRQNAIDAMCSACGYDCDKREFVYNAPQGEQVIMCPEHYALSTLPSAEPKIIHCKDCIWHNKNINQCNRQVCAVMYADDFCSYGERRGEQDE